MFVLKNNNNNNNKNIWQPWKHELLTGNFNNPAKILTIIISW